jgi:hypothetical protein
VTVDGGKKYTVDESTFEWPTITTNIVYDTHIQTVAIHRLSFSGFHNSKKFLVKPCEVIMVLGHGKKSAPILWDFTSACSAGGALTCWPKSNNPPADDPHRLPYVLNHDDQIFWIDPLLPRLSMARLHDEESVGDVAHYANLQVDPYLQGTYQKAREICEKNPPCCAKVKIKCVIADRIWDKLPPPFDFEVDCGSGTSQRDFNDAVRNWESTWRPHPPRENIPAQ